MVPWVKKYVGIPFKPLGREAIGGVDCWGLVCLVYTGEFGVELPLLTNSYEAVNQYRKIVSIAKEEVVPVFSKIDESEKATGDVVILHERGLPLHAGVYVGRTGVQQYLLHCTRVRGHSFLERLDGPDLSRSKPLYLRHDGVAAARAER